MLHVGENLMQVGSILGKGKVKSVLERKMYPGRSLQVSELEVDNYKNDFLFQVL